MYIWHLSGSKARVENVYGLRLHYKMYLYGSGLMTVWEREKWYTLTLSGHCLAKKCKFFLYVIFLNLLMVVN